MARWLQETGEVYQGQFGEFTVTSKDRLEVVVYRAALTTAATVFMLGTLLAMIGWGQLPIVAHVISGLFALFCLALGVSLWTIHIYLKPLHRTLQIFWGIGCVSALGIVATQARPLPVALYPPFSMALMGVGFVFVALTGLFVKEAFCFNRWQAKILILLVPLLLMGHWLNLLPLWSEKILLGTWAIVFLWFALDKDFQQIPPDIGDKTVFAYLKQSRLSEVH